MSMSYATLMVNLDVGRPNKACLHIAGELAARFEARLIGVAGADLQPQLYFAEGAAAAELIEKERGWLTSQIANCEKEFRNELKTLGDRIEWRGALEWPTGFVARNARAADLVIAGSAAGRTDTARQVDRGGLVMQAGRPVLIVPSETEWLRLKTVGRLEGHARGAPRRQRCSAAAAPGARGCRHRVARRRCQSSGREDTRGRRRPLAHSAQDQCVVDLDQSADRPGGAALHRRAGRGRRHHRRRRLRTHQIPGVAIRRRNAGTAVAAQALRTA